MIRALLKFFACSIFVVLLGTVSSGSAEAKRYRFFCQGEHLHYGSSSGHRSRSKAMKAAISDWAGFTAFEYGANYANWRIAKNKRVGCGRSTGRWKCSIEATPCRRNRKRR